MEQATVPDKKNDSPGNARTVVYDRQIVLSLFRALIVITGQPYAGRVCDYLRAVLQMQPLEDLCHVIADGALGQIERFAHRFIGHPLRDQRQNLALPVRQASRRL